MSYGHALSTATHIGRNAISGATSFGLGVGASALGKVGGNKLVNSIGGALQKFGNNIKSNNSPNSNPIKSGIQNGIGNTIEKFGGKVKNSTPSNIGKNMRMHGRENMGEVVSSIMPQRICIEGDTDQGSDKFMYITIKSIKKTLGKYIEMTDLYIGLPMLMLFLILFAFTNFKLQALVFLSVCAFLLIPINLSKKNRMYKVVILLFKYVFKCEEYICLK